LELINSCYSAGKTKKYSEKELMKMIYGQNVELTEDLWVSLKHTEKGIQQFYSRDEKGKIKIAPKKKVNELF